MARKQRTVFSGVHQIPTGQLAEPEDTADEATDSQQLSPPDTKPKIVLLPRQEQPAADGVEQKPKRRAPDNVPIPQNGLPSWKYWLYCKIGRPDWVPALDAHDQLDFDIDVSRQYLLYLANIPQLRGTKVYVGNYRGGAGKTTTTMGMADTLSLVSRLPIWATSTTVNMGNSSLARVAQVAGSTVSYSLLRTLLRANADPNEILSRVITTIGGTCILGEDKQVEDDEDGNVGSIDNGSEEGPHPDNETEIAEFHKGFHEVDEFLTNGARAQFRFWDTGNDSTTSQKPIAASSDVMVLVMKVGHPYSLEDLPRTRREFEAMTGNGETIRKEDLKPGQLRRGRQIPITEKAEHCITVLAGLRPGEDVQPYKKYVGKNAEFLVVPEDQYIMDNKGFDIYAINQETMLAYLQLTIKVLEQAAWLRGISLPDPSEVITIPVHFRAP